MLKSNYRRILCCSRKLFLMSPIAQYPKDYLAVPEAYRNNGDLIKSNIVVLLDRSDKDNKTHLILCDNTKCNDISYNDARSKLLLHPMIVLQ